MKKMMRICKGTKWIKVNKKEKTAERLSSLGTDPFLSLADHSSYSCPKEYEK
jgi:DNA-binding ferritin-like protein